MESPAKIILGDSRAMPELADQSVDLVVTSPPYWHIKDYGAAGQVGYGQSLHQYLTGLFYTWSECFRVLRPGRRLCLNIGDQFARARLYGRYKVIPLHAEFIAQCEQLGFDFMGSIIWQKKTTMNTTGGAVIMGSFPYPPNGLVELDYEFILIFKKPGAARKVPKELKEASRLSKEEWKEYFGGHWHFGGARQLGHEAMFPEELPRRLIRMFSFKGDTVLDPFLGSGTTVKVALELGRRGIGYEINEDFLKLIKEKLGTQDLLPGLQQTFDTVKRDINYVVELPAIAYQAAIPDANPLPAKEVVKPQPLHKVIRVVCEDKLQLEDGRRVGFLGITVRNKADAIRYLTDKILGRKIIIKGEQTTSGNNDTSAYIFLKNKIFINAYLIKSGLAFPDLSVEHKYKNKFIRLIRESGIRLESWHKNY